jgi:hypothetical protein
VPEARVCVVPEARVCVVPEVRGCVALQVVPEVTVSYSHGDLEGAVWQSEG